VSALLFSIPSFSQNAKTGKLGGKILDATSNEPLFGAAVFIKSINAGTTTDFDGKFQFQAPAGIYSVEIKMLGYQTKQIENVKITENEIKLLNLYLNETSVETREVEIVADVSNNNEDALLKDQKASNSINSGVSAELLSKTPDRNLSESFRRISGTSIREGKFAMVRGLSERYNMGQLNGVAITSTESDRKAFNLELFPSNLLDKIVVSKTATPDQPGDMAGGLIKIQTLDIPYSNSFQASFAVEHHSLTTGKDFSQLNHSPTDFLGFDNGLRQIPKGVMSAEQSQLNQNLQLRSDQSLAFNHNYVPSTRRAAPNLSGQISLGRRGKLFGKTAGLVASLNYYQTHLRNEFFYLFPTINVDSGGATIKESVRQRQDRFRTTSSLSAVLNGSVKPSSSTKISLRNFFSQTGSNLTQLGLSEAGNRLDSNTLEYSEKRSSVSFYEQNSLVSSQLSFEKFIGTEGGKLEWVSGHTYLYRNTPNYSRLIFDRQGIVRTGEEKTDRFEATFGVLPPVSFANDLSGKFFSEMDEQSFSHGLNLQLPFSIAKLKNMGKVGALYQTRSRTFDGRNFLYTRGRDYNEIKNLGPDSIFRPENFSPNRITLFETTNKADFYKAQTALSAAYLMNETLIGKGGSKIIYGLRYESFFQEIDAANPPPAKQRNIKSSTVEDWLPSVNANFNLGQKWAIRGAYSQTVNRPELRELAGFLFFEPSQNVYFYGNPELVRTKIKNYDLKLEWYPQESAFISLNGFYKTFDKPIEVTRGFQTALQAFTYSNRDEATSYGWELEARYRLNGLDSALGTRFFSKFTIFGNFSWIRSEVVYAQTNFKRPIQGQSPYIINAGIQYSHDKSGLDVLTTYNRIGPRVAFLDDQNYAALIWERPRDLIDLSISKNLKSWNLKIIFGDLLQQDLIQYIVFDRGGRKKDNTGLFGWVSNAPFYQEGQDIPNFRFTQGRTIRFAVTYKISK
jgi:outer membrane receptor protein involved in Fe transport